MRSEKPINCGVKVYTLFLGGGGQIGLTCEICRRGVPDAGGVAGVNCGDAVAFASNSWNIDRDCLPIPILVAHAAAM